MTELVLIRHAATEWTPEHRFQGRKDLPLSAAGRADAALWKLPAAFANYGRVSSPLLRARETAELMFGAPAAIEMRMTEMDWGAWEGRTIAELRAEFGTAVEMLEARGLDFCPPGGESPRQVQARVRPVLAELAVAKRSTVAVAHRGVMRAVYALAADWDMRGKPPAKLGDGCAHVFVLAPDGTPRVGRLNVDLRP